MLHLSSFELCTGVLWLPKQNTIDWVASTTEALSLPTHFWRVEVQDQSDRVDYGGTSHLGLCIAPSGPALT